LPRNTFSGLGVPEDLTRVLDRGGFTSPFPIQAATLPDALSGKDIAGKAPTGSGKTLAFGLALVARIPRAKPKRPTALVLVPTRELAAQVAKEIEPFARARNVRIATVYGGVGYGEQRAALRKGTDILVACPGRLEDLLEQRDLVLSDVRIAVVDEADRMADMGFLPAVRRLLDATSKDRQTLLFSATLDGDVDVLVKHYQRNPSKHSTADEKTGDVDHVFWRTQSDQRLQLTAALIQSHDTAIVFCRTRHGADRLAKQLKTHGVKSAAIHGSRTQSQRDRALADFKSGRVRALVATDVAARGIHVDNVSCVVHFDPPSTDKDYVHRSGRTGRAGANGKVVSLVAPHQDKEVRALQKSLKMQVPIERPGSTLNVSEPKEEAGWDRRKLSQRTGPHGQRRTKPNGARYSRRPGRKTAST
jgi:superfamily II DNA/RNA helicase